MKAPKARFTKILQIEDGFTLTEVMIAVGISAMITLSIVTTLSIAASSQANIEKTSEVDSVMEEVNVLLSDRNRCTLNLTGTTVPPTTDLHGGALATPSIRDFDAAGTPGSTLLAVGATANGITPTDIRLVNMAQLDSTHVAARLTFTFQKPNVLGPATVVRNIPVTITTSAGTVSSCATGAAGTLNVANQVCAMSGNADMWTLNPETGKCEEKALTWFDGDDKSATCPPGYKIPPIDSEWQNCDWIEPVGFTWTPPCAIRRMADGTEMWMCPNPVVMAQDLNTNTCSTTYASGINSTGFKIRVRCMLAI